MLKANASPRGTLRRETPGERREAERKRSAIRIEDRGSMIPSLNRRFNFRRCLHRDTVRPRSPESRRGRRETVRLRIYVASRLPA